MLQFQESFDRSAEAAAFIKGVEIALRLSPNPNVIVRPVSEWTVEIHMAAPEKKEECEHLTGRWISMNNSFRCYTCGYQFRVRDIPKNPKRRIERWRI